MKRPLRIEICHLLAEHSELSTEEIIQYLKKMYTNEKQIYMAEDHILSLRAVGIIKLIEEKVEKKNEKQILMQKWGLTEFGKEKYLRYW